jgi:hypothetical protein
MARTWTSIRPDQGDNYEVRVYGEAETGNGCLTFEVGGQQVHLWGLTYGSLRELLRDAMDRSDVLKPPQSRAPTLAEEAAYITLQGEAIDPDDVFDLAEDEAPTMTLLSPEVQEALAYPESAPLAETPPGWKDLEEMAQQIQAGTFRPDPRD